MATYAEDIIQALKNLGGEATLNQIYNEVELIRTVPLPINWQANIRGTIEDHSSDSYRFKGKDYFQRVKKGVWALRNQEGIKSPAPGRKSSAFKSNKETLFPESYETILNYLRTIKEYRDFSDPTSLAWREYIQEFFHIIGFSTQQKDSRLILLTDLGRSNTPKAIVAYSLPAENFEEILPGLKWDTFLLLAANYYQVEWGILTNGLRIKIINFQAYKNSKSFFETDLDEIIKKENSEVFFALYKVFSNIKNRSGLS